MLWLWPAATVPILALVWDLPYAVGMALKRPKKKKKRKKKKKKERKKLNMMQIKKTPATEL